MYQCSARNIVGNALSNTTLVVRSVEARFQNGPVRERAATIGESLRLDCQPDRQSVPSPGFTAFSWQDNGEIWPLSRRVQIDDNGMHAGVPVLVQVGLGRGMGVATIFAVEVHSLAMHHFEVWRFAG